jgi:murein L,D-transpeptidase YafK
MSRTGTIALIACAAILLPALACGAPPAAGDSAATTAATALPVTTAPATEASTTAPPSTAVAATVGAEQTTVTSQAQPAGPEIVIRKSARQLDLYHGGVLTHTYRIALGFAPEGDKEREGDGRTPEGQFYVCVKNPESSFGVSLGVSYPSRDDAERGLRQNLIDQREYGLIVAAIDAGQAPPMKTALGGEIYIHAGGSDRDWTQGCVGLDEGDMAELYAAVEVGTPITIEP